MLPCLRQGFSNFLSRSILSAPALSLDRIQIDYGARRILISPRERQRFVDELRQRCPKARITGF